MEGRLGRQQGQLEVVNVGGTTIRITSAIEDNPATARLANRLNGGTGRAIRLFHTKARELEATGSVTQAQIIRHTDSSRPPVIGVQSGDSSPDRRVRAFFSREGEVFTLRAICKADEDGKALDALRNMGYTQALRTGRS